MAWDYLLDAAAPIFPYGAKSNTSELRVDYPNGAQVRLFGADNYEALRGLRFDGVVLDEYANFDPRAWPEVISPTLADRRGFAVFIGTPAGHNDFYRIWQKAQEDKDWYALCLKASDTVPQNDRLTEDEAIARALLTSKELARAREIMTPDQYEQEYQCSFEAAIIGSYYGKQIQQAYKDKRITGVPYDPAAAVWTSWDLGIRDATAIWFIQLVGKEIHLIDSYESTGQPLDHYVKILNEKQYAYAGHIVPHDAQAKELGTGKSRLEVMESLGLRNITVATRHRVEDGINAARVIFPRCWFDQKRCELAIEALTLYRSNYNEKLEALTTQPVHDWCFTGDTDVLTRHGMCQIRNLPNSGEILTPCGYKAFHSPRITRKSAQLVEVRFSDGLSVRCTPDHLFMTANGWRSAEHLMPGTPIQSSLTYLRSISMAASTVFGRVRSITRAAAKSCIEMFGHWLSEKFRRAATSIIGTPIQPTICWQTSNASPQGSMHLKLGNATEKNAIETGTSLFGHARLPQNGMAPKPVGYGTVETPSGPRTGQNGSALIANVITAAKNLKCWSAKAATAKSFARLIAKPLIIECVKELPDKEDVWCLTVPGEESFSLANGAVVHNCSHFADSFRYLAQALDQMKPKHGFSGPINYPKERIV